MRRQGQPAERLRGRPIGIGRTSDRAAERVSDELRLADTPTLRRRRWSAGLTLLAAGAYAVVATYQYGLVRHLSEPALPWLDADRVDASGEAYAAGHTPDTALALANAGVTLALIGTGDADRATRQPWRPLLAAGKAAGDAAAGAWLFAEQLSRHRRICGWCTLAAATTVVAAALTVPEATRAWRHLRGRPA
ncbi:vitamin K epoxide reductase family protein [Solwaraspora sp. WMMD792]|uniref:vitamin K epoxide reductase family protein n=1 Tax=Solwaraspora sp. WMMD792 TaxID=3016099 RepID=UPI00241748C1|nr:vitamin K epoxide reductase family protein [Solwaraspora sp. WMMD792]MDG4771705.1 vitamin K epoxide reductase family protein [Solwaraspora sp. WMMD792]